MNSIIDHNGVERFMGNLQPPKGTLSFTSLSGFGKVYGAGPATPMFARSQWPALIQQLGDGPEHPALPYVHDQDGVGQCNADATAAAVEFCRAVQGLPFVKLSAADLYERIKVGGGDNGSLLEDAQAEMNKVGIGTADTAGLIWRRGMRGASPEERALYRVLEYWLCPSFDHVMSAALAGCALISGISWHDNYTPDGDGWLPRRGAGGGGGHAVMGYKPAMSRSGGFGVWHQNSWTPQWGLGGRCVFPEEAYGRDIGGWWAVRQAVTEAGDIPAPRG